MTAPAIKHKSIPYLVKDLTRQSQFRGLATLTTELVQMAISPPASLALWILHFQPELATRSSLKIEIFDSDYTLTVDDGRWFTTLPWLVGNPELALDITFIGKSLSASEKINERNIKRSPLGFPTTQAAKTLGRLASVKAYGTSAADYLADEGATSKPDLIILHLQGLTEDFALNDTDALTKLCSKRVPIGISSVSGCLMTISQELLDASGFSPKFGGAYNVFVTLNGLTRPGPTPSLWEIEPVTPEETLGYDAPQVAALTDLSNRMLAYGADDHRVFAGDSGELYESLRDCRSRTFVENAVGLPHIGTAVALDTGKVFAYFEDPDTPAIVDAVLPAELMARFPRDEPYSANNLLWSVDAMDWLGEHVLKTHLHPESSLKYRPARAWFLTLELLGWQPVVNPSFPPLTEPAFFVPSAELGEKIPVFYQNGIPEYHLGPDHIDNGLRTLIETNDTTALVMFSTTMVVATKVGRKKTITCIPAGVSYHKGKWALFFLNKSIVNVDMALAHQQNTVDPDDWPVAFEDKNSEVRAFFDNAAQS